MRKKWFDGASVILTGASSGIGLELARRLVEEHGCTVVGLARRAEKLAQIAGELGPRFLPHPMDVTDRAAWEALPAWLEDEGIAPDLLVNNAGMLPRFASYPGAGGAEGVRQALELNFFAQTVSCEVLLPSLRRSKRGGIVNVASSAALAFLPGTAAYSAGKAASLAFTQCLSTENKGRLYVASVCPGYTKTPLFDAQKGWKSGESRKKSFIKSVAMEPDKMARKILSAVGRKRRKIVLGIDAHGMAFLYRLLGTPALDLFGAVMKATGDEMFEDIS